MGDEEEADEIAKEDEDEEESDSSDILGHTDDPVRLYLREMSYVKLLSREEEIAISKEIVSEKEGRLYAMILFPSVLQNIEGLLEKLKEKKIAIRDFTESDSGLRSKINAETEKENS